jgi:hypothetical protein
LTGCNAGGFRRSTERDRGKDVDLLWLTVLEQLEIVPGEAADEIALLSGLTAPTST